MQGFIDLSNGYSIDAIEVGDSFLTVYISGSDREKLIEFGENLLDIDLGHNEEVFHPNGQEWRKTGRPFEFHYHYPKERSTIERIENFLNPEVRRNVLQSL
mgnify:CR=1 FL=1